MLITKPGLVIGQSLQWAKGMGGPYLDVAYSIKTDAAGNVYTTGIYGGTADFDPGPGVYNLTAVGGNSDVFISKLDASGNFLWAKSIGGYSVESVVSLNFDHLGNPVISGTFASPVVDFDPGVGVFYLNTTSSDAYILKLDPQGDFINAIAYGGAGAPFCNDFCFDSIGNIYLTGSFFNTADFDPGVATVNRTSVGNTDIFVLKLDSLWNYQWVRTFGGPGSDIGNDITIDSTGNILIAGEFEGTVDFQPGPGTFNLSSQGDVDAFLALYTNTGFLTSALRFGGGGYDVSSKIATDPTGSIYLLGTFTGSVDFDPGPGISNMVSNSFSRDAFLIKINSSLNLVWRVSFGSNGIDYGKSIDIDPACNIYIAGTFVNTIDLDPGPGTNFVTANAGGYYSFLVKIDSSSIYQWSQVIESSIGVTCFDVSYTTGGFLNSTGSFTNSANFNLPSNTTLSGSSATIFVAKYHTNLVLPIDLIKFEGSCIDQVELFWSTATEINNDYFTIEKSNSGMDFNSVATIKGAGNSSTINDYKFIDNSTSLEPTYYRLKQTDFDGKTLSLQTIFIHCLKLDEPLIVIPNPIINYSNIKSNYNFKCATLEIVNTTGVVVFSESGLNGNEFKIFNQSYAPGIYYIRLIEQNNTFSQNKIIQIL